MPTHDKEYYSAIGLLSQGVDPHDVAKQLGTSESKIIRWNTEFKQHKDDGTLDKLLDMEELAIHTACELMELPVQVEANAIARVSGFQALEKATQTCALHLVNRIQSMAMSASGSGELSELVDSLCKVQTAFFNPNKVQVNVQNNLTEGRAYGSFLGDKPGA